ncbi:hypothetical protein SAMN06298216_2736 [Spirosomataceae bacterium TFI 002]|nr:hypothetical protein SAMN06298216_2736 [Spirosomataceae bacterium TFI 002]
MTKIENFIKENRSQFDLKEPSEALWSKIAADLQENKGATPRFSWPWRSMGIAASVAILLSLGYFTGRYGRPMSANRDIINISASHGTSVVKYETFIEDKRNQLETMSIKNPEMVSGFEQDLDELNASYLKLRSMLPNNPNQERILNEMVRNLQWQLELLNRQLILMEGVESDDVVMSEENLKLDMI